MLNIEGASTGSRVLTEFEALVATSPTTLDAFPCAVYLCDADGLLVRYNAEAARLWGREPRIGSLQERFCGSQRMFLLDGSPLPHEACPMAEAVQRGVSTCNQEVVIERPDGSRIVALVNIRPLRDANGRIEGAINCFQDITARKELEEEARRKSAELEDFFENSAIGLHIVNGEGTIMRANKAELALLGYTAEEYVGRHIAEFHADLDTIQDILECLGAGRRLERHPARLVAKDGSIKHVLITSNSRFVEGRFVNTRCFTTDVTDLHVAKAALDQSEQHMRDLLEALPAAVYAVDVDGRISFFNKACIEIMGRVPSAGDLWSVAWRLYGADGAPVGRDEHPMALAMRENRPLREVEVVAERPDGSRVPLLTYPTPLRGADGAPVGGINILVDISDRKRAESQQKALIDELNHRVKNTLASVQSLARQTARHADDLDSFVETLEARLLALARAHDLLTRRQWRATPLALLLQEVVSPLAGDAAERLRFSGPSVSLSPRAALSLTMALNELATNAAKYGALSSSAGCLAVAWALEDDDGVEALRVTWREHGGPPVQAPRRRGFGSRMMERCVERDLDGQFDLEFEPQGVCASMVIPVSRLGGPT